MASLRIEGATQSLILYESEAGLYEGSYTISGRDRIEARSPVTANLRVGNQVASAVLNESLQVGVGYHSKKAIPGSQPTIERFDVEPVADLSGGSDLHFTLIGTPGGKVDLTINGVKGKVLLPEVNRGEYANIYTIKNRDRIMPDSRVTANLRLGERVASVTLSNALQNAAASANSTRICNNCGTVEAINLVETKGEGSYLGADRRRCRRRLAGQSGRRRKGAYRSANSRCSWRCVCGTCDRRQGAQIDSLRSRGSSAKWRNSDHSRCHRSWPLGR